MKTSRVGIILVVAVAVGLGWYWLVRRPNAGSESQRGGIDGVLTVKQVYDNPEEIAGEIKVLGIVSQVEQEEGLFGLVDEGEGLSCVGGQCSSCLLPVLWGGAMPEIGQTITVSGRI